MSRPRKYPDELIQRGVRLALESGRPIAHVARDIGLPSETLRKCVRQAEADQGCGRICPPVRSVRRSSSYARRTSSCAARTRSSRQRASFSRPSSTQTGRSERVHRAAPRALRRRADLPDVGRVEIRVLPAADRSAVRPAAGVRAAARADPRGSQGQLRGLRIPAHVEGAAQSRGARPALPGAAADAVARDPGRQASRQAVAHYQARPERSAPA